MADNLNQEIIHKQKNLPQPGKVAVTLPCHPDDFKEFVGNLLGKPQTIEKYFSRGTFVITHEDILNTFHLIDQRITQQNEASLIQFVVKIFYDDDSAVTVNSLDDFVHFKEIRPLKSESVYLSWTYLVKFQQKNAPEKQQIELRIRTERNNSDIINEDGISTYRSSKWYGPKHISFRISHTERTWGVDIEALLTGHINTFITVQNTFSRFITRQSANIGLSVGTLFLVSSILVVFMTIKKFTNSYLHELKEIAEKTIPQSDLLAQKVDFLTKIIAEGTWTRFSFSIFSFMVVSLILSIVLGIWVGTNAYNKPSSFILLSKASTKYQEKVTKRKKRDWYLFGISIIFSVITSVVANIIFSKYFASI